MKLRFYGADRCVTGSCSNISSPIVPWPAMTR